MSADIGPGDFVECVDASPAVNGTQPFLAGSIYVVTHVWPPAGNDLRTGKPSSGAVDIRWVPRAHPNVGWEISRFRPVYRPKPDALADLLNVPTKIPEHT